VDAKHAEKHELKMDVSQEVTGDFEIDKIFSKEFISKVSTSYSYSGEKNPSDFSASQDSQEPNDEELPLPSEEESDFSWMDE
jgi:hypothetical protein